MRTGQKFLEALGANGDRQRQADGRPHRITPAHPVPKAEGGADAKGAGRRHVGGECRKMPRDVGAAIGLEPGLGRLRVGHGLDGGEGFAGHQEQRALRLELSEHRVELVPVHIRDKMESFAGKHEFVKRQHRHLRPEVGAANADVDDVGDASIRAHCFGKDQHGIQRGVHLVQRLGHVPVHRLCRHRRVQRRCSQQPVHHGALLGGVDGLAGKHGIAVLGQPGLLRQFQQQGLRVSASIRFLDRSANTWGALWLKASKRVVSAAKASRTSKVRPVDSNAACN